MRHSSNSFDRAVSLITSQHGTAEIQQHHAESEHWLNVRSSLTADLQRHVFVCCVPGADVATVKNTDGDLYGNHWDLYQHNES